MALSERMPVMTEAAAPTPYQGYSVDQVVALMDNWELPSRSFLEQRVDGSQLVALDYDGFTKGMGLMPGEARRLLQHLQESPEWPPQTSGPRPATKPPTPLPSVSPLAVRPIGPLVMPPLGGAAPIPASNGTPAAAVAAAGPLATAVAVRPAPAVIGPPTASKDAIRQRIYRRTMERTPSPTKVCGGGWDRNGRTCSHEFGEEGRWDARRPGGGGDGDAHVVGRERVGPAA